MFEVEPNGVHNVGTLGSSHSDLQASLPYYIYVADCTTTIWEIGLRRIATVQGEYNIARQEVANGPSGLPSGGANISHRPHNEIVPEH